MFAASTSDADDAFVKLLHDGKKDMLTTCNESNITVEYLEAVAKIRFVCFSVNELLYKRSLQKCFTFSASEKLLLQGLQAICEDVSLNPTDSGPGIFFMKQIARQHGISFLGKISTIEETQWIIPTHLRKGNKVY